MLTRKMSEITNERITELERLISEQTLQIERLTNLTNMLNVNEASTLASVSSYDVTKIPDVIKMIPGYDGSIKGLPAWIDSVEQKLECATVHVPAAEKETVLKIWTSIIRDKISGKANEALLSNQTECKWEAIKSFLDRLVDRFGDKRDLSSIIGRTLYVKQGNRSVEEFYSECAEILADLNAKVILNPGLKPCAKEVMASYEAMLTNAFVDGLDSSISSLTRTGRAVTLVSAFQHAMEHENANKRREEANKFQIAQLPPSQRTQLAPNINPMQNYNARSNQTFITNKRFPQNFGQNRNYPQLTQVQYSNQNRNPQQLVQRFPPQNQNFNQTRDYPQFTQRFQLQNSNLTPNRNQPPFKQGMLPIKQEPFSQNNFRSSNNVNQVHYQELNEQPDEKFDTACGYQQEPFNCQEVQEEVRDNSVTDDEINFPPDTNPVPDT